MKKLFCLLFIALLYTGCEKKENTAITDMNIESVSIVPHQVEETVTIKAKTLLQEQIENYNEKYVLLFLKEGNFTNSGHKEILAFYQAKSSLVYEGRKNNSVHLVYCFIIDESNQEILNVIDTKYYGTMEPEGHLEGMPLEALGRKVMWLGKIFGYIGDFNNNGKEELYFFEISSPGIASKFYEFDGNDFKELLSRKDSYSLNLDRMNITHVDAENKILTFEYKNEDRAAVRIAWNDETRMYERIEESEIEILTN